MKKYVYATPICVLINIQWHDFQRFSSGKLIQKKQLKAVSQPSRFPLSDRNGWKPRISGNCYKMVLLTSTVVHWSKKVL